MDAHIRFDHALLAVESAHTVNCMLELTAPPAPDADARPPLNLVVVLDRSGSMGGPKLEIAKECAAYLARRLGECDRMGVVTYDDDVRLLAPMDAVTPNLLGAIHRIHPGA